MVSTHPDVKGHTNDALIRCIEECYSCAQTCTSCADACLAEQMVRDLTQCIRLNLDCADICNTTGRIATRRTGSDEEVIRRMLDVCATACRLCADECQRVCFWHEGSGSGIWDAARVLFALLLRKCLDRLDPFLAFFPVRDRVDADVE